MYTAYSAVRRQEIDAMAMEEVPRAKHELSLYAHISKISWHYEVTDRIRGGAVTS